MIAESIKRAKPDASYKMHSSNAQIQLEWMLISQKNAIDVSAIRPTGKVVIVSMVECFVSLSSAQPSVHDPSYLGLTPTLGRHKKTE
jgi:hypothetical protein